ncbi:MAG: type II secretion system protein GspK, partial [Planctomycetota bacterium]
MLVDRNPARDSDHDRDGFILIVVLVVVVIATLAVFTFADVMLAHDQAAVMSGRRAQADSMVQSGIEMTRLVLSQPQDVRNESGGVFNNPQLFQAINVKPEEDPTIRGNVTIIAPSLDEQGQLSGIRYGLQNESARLNLNVLTVLEQQGSSLLPLLDGSGDITETLLSSATDSGTDGAGVAAAGPEAENSLAERLLQALPGMNYEISAAIMDWLDEDDEPRLLGAESDYYLTLPTPYAVKNGPLDSVGELLQIKGITPQMLFGADANRNGVIDAGEQQLSGGGLDLVSQFGWSAFLTVHSQEGNKQPDGNPRVFVNADDIETLLEELSAVIPTPEYSSFIAAYRVNGEPGVNMMASLMAAGDPDQAAATSADAPSEFWSAEMIDDVDLSGGGGPEISSGRDLIDAVGAGGDGDDARRVGAPVTA